MSETPSRNIVELEVADTAKLPVLSKPTPIKAPDKPALNDEAIVHDVFLADKPE